MRSASLSFSSARSIDTSADRNAFAMSMADFRLDSTIATGSIPDMCSPIPYGNYIFAMQRCYLPPPSRGGKEYRPIFATAPVSRWMLSDVGHGRPSAGCVAREAASHARDRCVRIGRARKKRRGFAPARSCTEKNRPRTLGRAESGQGCHPPDAARRRPSDGKGVNSFASACRSGLARRLGVRLRRGIQRIGDALPFGFQLAGQV